MKNFILIAFIFCSTISFAQTADEIVGKWTITGMAGAENLDKEAQEMLTKAIGFNLDLKKDKKFVMSTPDKVMTGTWKLNGKAIELLSDKTKKTVIFTIKKFLKNELRIIVKEKELILGRVKSK